MKLTADDLAEDIRRIDGNHDMGAGKLAEALFAAGWRHIATRSPEPLKTYTLDEILDDLGPEHRAKVEKRFQELLADYNSQEPMSSSQPAKPAGAVPMPMRFALIHGLLNPQENGTLCRHEDAIAYSNAREAAAGGVPDAWRAFVEECSRTAGGEVCGNRLSMRAKSLLEAIHQQPAAQGAFDLLAHLIRQREWSERTFGPGNRTAGVIDHIRKELIEVESSPDDVTEWIDIVILALDGAWRAGHDAATVIAALQSKQAKNESRTWPDWRNADPSKAIDHDRSGESAAVSQQPTVDGHAPDLLRLALADAYAHGERSAEFALEGCISKICAAFAKPAAERADHVSDTGNKVGHPIQPLMTDHKGVVRFKANAIVRFLLDRGPFNMNDIAVEDFDSEDREQFAQLIGYSHSGAGDLSYVSDGVWYAAQTEYESRTKAERCSHPCCLCPDQPGACTYIYCPRK